MRKLLAGVGVALLFLAGCAPVPQAAPRPIVNAPQKKAVMVFELQGATPAAPLKFSDKDIEVTFRPGMQQLAFTLENKSSGAVKIDWNTVSFVDFNKNSRRVIHEGVKLIDRNGVQAASVVAPGARFSDFVYPADLISYTPGRYGGWDQLPMFRSGEAEQRVGQTFSVFMPLEVDGKTKNYNFVFVIKGVDYQGI